MHPINCVPPNEISPRLTFIPTLTKLYADRTGFAQICPRKTQVGIIISPLAQRLNIIAIDIPIVDSDIPSPIHILQAARIEPKVVNLDGNWLATTFTSAAINDRRIDGIGIERMQREHKAGSHTESSLGAMGALGDTTAGILVGGTINSSVRIERIGGSSRWLENVGVRGIDNGSEIGIGRENGSVTRVVVAWASCPASGGAVAAG